MPATYGQNLEGTNEASFQLPFVLAVFFSGRCGIVTTPWLSIRTPRLGGPSLRLLAADRDRSERHWAQCDL